jgi:hypothetical protein
MICTECCRPMRGARESLASRPGTIGYGSRGLCTGCYKKCGPGAAAAAALAAAPGNRASLEAYLRSRRPYRLKAGTA